MTGELLLTALVALGIILLLAGWALILRDFHRAYFDIAEPRGRWLREIPAIQARAVLSARSRAGWHTRRRRMDEARREAIGRDIEALI
jgi:hypothetical protein